MLAGAAAALANNKAAATGLIEALSTLAILSIGSSIASIFKSFSAIPFGLGIAAAVGTVAAMRSLIKSAQAEIADDMIMPAGYGDTVIKSPKGTIALNNQDSVVAGTNLFGGGNAEAKETNRLLKEYLSRGTQLKVGATNFNNQQKVYGYSI